MENKGVSTVIAVLLMLVITLSLIGLAYGFITGIFGGRIATTFSIADTYGDTVTVRNDGTVPISSFTKFTVDGEAVNYSVVPEDSSLVGHWKFDEGSGDVAGDSSGKGNDGTLVNDPTWVDGKFGKALSFDGSDNYVEVLDSDSLNITDEITIESWVYVVGSSGKIENIVYKAVSATSTEGVYRLRYFDNTNFIGNLSIGGTYYSNNGDTTVPLNTWHHVVLTYDGSNIKLFLNGKEDTTPVAVSGTIDTNNYPLFIGSRDGGFNGTIDEVRIYNRALSPEEIKAEYNMGGQINAGLTAKVKIYDDLSRGTHTVKICTPSMCTTTYLTII